MIYEILQSAHRPSDSRWRLIFSLPISTFSALGVSHVMRSINVRYLLTYLLTYLPDSFRAAKMIWKKGFSSLAEKLQLWSRWVWAEAPSPLIIWLGNFLLYASWQWQGQSLGHRLWWLPADDTWSYKPLQVVGNVAALATCTIPHP